MRKVPRQKPGRSKQDYATPEDFLEAVEARFGAVCFDLAADRANATAPNFFCAADNALQQNWSALPRTGWLWLNCPYSDIGPWAAKCLDSKSRILFLTPASVGANWFQRCVMHKAYVLFLTPRLSFDGKNPYPKDLILSVFGGSGGPGFDGWKWK